jgi:hypothetical protein
MYKMENNPFSVRRRNKMEEKELDEFIQDGKLVEEWFRFFLQNDPYFCFYWHKLGAMHISDDNKLKILAVALAKTRHDHQIKIIEAIEKKEAKV